LRYVGGKERIAKWVVENLLAVRGDTTRYVEPFVGGAAILTRMVDYFEEAEAGDSHEDLVLLLQAAAYGWAPPMRVTKEEYFAAKAAEPSALRGAIGFGSSWGAKWFGGYVDTPYDKHWDRLSKPHAGALSEALQKAAPKLAKARIYHQGYKDWVVGKGDLVYCDPPYSGTLGYHGGKFDSAEFWQVMGKWVENGAVVVVSEVSAPEGWAVLAERTRKAFLRVASQEENEVRAERLFIKDG